MKRVATSVALVAVLAIAASVAGLAISSASAGPAGKAKAGATQLTVWHGWSAREASEFKKVVAEYDKKNANVEIKVVPSISDDKIIAAIKSGNPPDVVSSFDSSNVGVYCGTGAWIDLAPYLKKDNVNVNIFPKASQYYTQYKGKRCALPLLADTAGLYYNTTLLQGAGLSGPPKTMAQLADYAKKLTVKNADGSLKQVGFNPFWGWYENTPERYAPIFGAKWVDANGKSMLSRDPAWAKMLKWQKSLVDFYGYKNLVKFNTGAGDEWSASNAFESGKVAMHLDGEWRVAFIAAEKPALKYATAPMSADKPSLYGAGYINGTIIGIPKGGENPDEAWALTKYLTTNDHALAMFSNGIRNVPSTKSSANSKELKPDPNFAVFPKILNHPKSATVPITAAGSAYLELINSFFTKYQAGRVKDLQAGLRDLDKKIDAQLAQAEKGGGGPP